MNYWIMLAVFVIAGAPMQARTKPWCGSSTPPELCNKRYFRDLNSGGQAEKEAGFVYNVTITNNSCHTMTSVSLNNVPQNGAGAHISPGETRTYQEFNQCLRSLQASNIGGKAWTSRFSACRGRMVDNYTWTLVDERQDSADLALPEDSLIVENSHRGDGYGGEIEITSKRDCVVIEKLILNRGNCPKITELPKVLNFGQSVKYYYFNPCNKLLELEIATDQGSDTFTWSK